jgi:hypothetical protein
VKKHSSSPVSFIHKPQCFLIYSAFRPIAKARILSTWQHVAQRKVTRKIRSKNAQQMEITLTHKGGDNSSFFLSGLPRGTQSIHQQRQECSSPMELEVYACLLLQACCCKGSLPFTNCRWSHMCSLILRKVKSGSRQWRAGIGASHHSLVMYHWKQKPKRVWGFRV